MKRYIKEIIILLIQLLMFYIFPVFMYLYEPIGTVMLILLTTFILSVVLSSISKNKIKYLYPIIISILFIPSVFIYYNESALVHALWYLVISYVGVIFGAVIYKLTHRKKNKIKGEE